MSGSSSRSTSRSTKRVSEEIEAEDEREHKKRSVSEPASVPSSEEGERTPDLIRRASTSILSSIGASRTKPLAALDEKEEGELRSFYLHLMEKRQREGWAAVESVLYLVAEEMKGANSVGSTASSANPAPPLSYVVSQTGPEPGVLQKLEAEVVLCGRLAQCHCKLGHEVEDGNLVENRGVSRVQFILMRLGDELVVLDCWSICGTRTVRREADAVLQSSRPGARSTLIFGAAERFTLEVAKDAQITFNPTEEDVREAAEKAEQSGSHDGMQQPHIAESGSTLTVDTTVVSPRGAP